jgi:HK97 family phage portal protein
VLGLSPVAYARQAIGLGLAVERFGASFFGDGASPSGLLTTNTMIGDEQAEVLNEKWKSIHGKKRKTALLTGDLKWTPISIAPEESQFVETCKLNVAQIARVFGVPPEMIGGESGQSLTYANIESRALHFLKFSLAPLVYPTRSRARSAPSVAANVQVQHWRAAASRYQDAVRGA